MAARFICVLLDFFITAVERQRRPDLVGKPVIVGGDPTQHGLVVAVSPESAGFGVAPGMPSWEALQYCPQAALISPHPDLYQSKAQMVLSLLSLYSDDIEHSKLDCFYLRVPGEVDDIAAGIQQQLAAQIRISASLGVAANKLVAHIAARLHAPGGLVSVPAGEEASFLHPLPLEWLAGDDKMRAQLKRLGLRTIGDLAAVPEHLLISHIGEAGKALLRHARGKDARPLRPTQQHESVEYEQTFERTITDREALRRWVVYLAGQAGQQIRAQKYLARTLTLTLGHLDHPPVVLTLVLPKATDLDRTLRDAALHLLAAWDGRTGVVSLGLAAGVFIGEQTFQLQLFDEKENEWEVGQRRLDHAKNGLNKRYGQGTVMAAMLLDDEILTTMGKRRRNRSRQNRKG